jgi:hypothetical protein
LRMNFAEIYRAFKGARQRYEEKAILTREIAYLTYAVNCKNPTPKNIWWPIGEIQRGPEPTQEELDEIWQKHGKLN